MSIRHLPSDRLLLGSMPKIDYTQLTAITILFLIFIREFFAYLKTKKNGKINGNGEVLKAIENLSGNHLSEVNTKLDYLTNNQRTLGNKLDEVIKLLIQINARLNGRK